MTKISIVLILLLSFTGFNAAKVATLKGTWQFAGGIYNGKPDGAPKTYTMQRIYSDHDFKAYASQKGYKTEKYEAGNYILKGDTCFEKQTYSSRPSQATGKTIVYIFKVQNNELILSGTLPSGMVVEEHWKKIR